MHEFKEGTEHLYNTTDCVRVAAAPEEAGGAVEEADEGHRAAKKILSLVAPPHSVDRHQTGSGDDGE